MEIDNLIVPDFVLSLLGPDVLVEAPPGFKRVALELARRTGAKVSGRPVWGSCDVGLQDAEALGLKRVVHLGHGVPPNIGHLLKKNTGGSLEKIDVDTYLLKARGVEAYFVPVYYVPPPSLPRPPAGKIYFPLPYRLIAEELALQHSMEVAREPITGCWVGEPPGGPAVVVSSGYFYPLAVKLFYPDVEVWGYDPFRGKSYSVEGEYRRLMGLKARAHLGGWKKAVVVVSRKPGQMQREEAERVAARLGAVVVEVDETSPELLDDLGADLVVNTACPRVGFDDLDRIKTPVVNLHELEGFKPQNIVRLL
ncbi:MAG: diphthamide synthesis protein [Thermoproteus sp.]